MSTALYITVTLMIFIGLLFAIHHLVRTYLRYRGLRIITCPDTTRPAIVEVDALHAALTSTVGMTDIHLKQCSRWPLQQECGQDCLTQIDAASGQDQVSGVLMRWYKGKQCVYCGHEFKRLHWLDDKPALQSPEGKLLEWHQVPRESLETVLNDYLPVCWNCYLVQFFHRQYPGMVVYQPYKHGFSGSDSARGTAEQSSVGTLSSSQPVTFEVSASSGHGGRIV